MFKDKEGSTIVFKLVVKVRTIITPVNMVDVNVTMITIIM
jgi:hypothetical protein